MGSRNNLHRVIVIRVPLMYYVLHGILWTYFIHYYSFKIYIYLKAIGNTLNRIYQYIYNYILDIYLLTPTHTETATHPHTHTPNTPPRTAHLKLCFVRWQTTTAHRKCWAGGSARAPGVQKQRLASGAGGSAL